MVRTPERESKFHWLGVISKPQYYLFALKDSEFTKSNHISSFKNYTIATLLNSATHVTLKAEGFKNIVPLAHAKQIFGMLRKKRVDFITANKPTFQTICTSYRVKCDDILAIAPIEMPKSSSLYFAMNKESDLALVNILKVTYKKLLLKGEITVF